MINITYNYKCESCGEFTVEQSMKDKPLEKCPKCGKGTKRIFKPSGIHVKCEGFFGKSYNK